ARLLRRRFQHHPSRKDRRSFMKGLGGLAPSTTLDDEARAVHNGLVDRLGLDADCRELVARDPWEISDAPAVRQLLHLLPFEGRDGAPYWMESAMWETAGVPTVVCGPAGGGLHTVEEWVELDQLRAYAEALASLLPAFAR
ncbi:MAG: hypothetical protein ACJ75Q_11585, partial [Gaiellaceae bacterium]